MVRNRKADNRTYHILIVLRYGKERYHSVFKEREIALSEIKATDIQAFYMKQLKRVKANTVIHYHLLFIGL